MKIHVIIPCFNERENLERLLPSLLSKIRDQKIMVTIADSPLSTDHVKSLTLQNLCLYHLCSKNGRAYQMNEVAKKSKCQWLLFLHADVFPPNDFVDCILQSGFQKYKAGFFSYQFDPSNFLLNINAKYTKRDGFFAGGGDQCQFIEKNTFLDLKGFNEEYCIMEDFELIDRIRKKKIPYQLIQSNALVSSRKYQKHSYFKIQIINLITFIKYKLGVHPIKLRKTYKTLLREGY